MVMETNVSLKTLNLLNISETVKQAILKNKIFGVTFGDEFSNKVYVTKEQQYNASPSALRKISKESFLNHSPIKLQDVLGSINGYHLIKHNGEFCYLDERTGQGYRITELPFQDGESVKVTFYRKDQKPSSPTQASQENQQNPFVQHTTVMKFNWVYNVSNFPEVVEQLKRLNVVGLDSRVKEKLFNQDHAVDKVFKAVKINAVGLKDDSKPIGSFLLTGPTGTGKTELAKLMAKEMDFPLVRVDMSEFMHEHMVSRFIGSPQGYVGYNDKSFLEQEIGEDKRSLVLLLDEMEKSHYNIQKIFLQAMDNARITLANNKVVDFSNVLILMTSNCGVITKNGISFLGASQLFKVDQEKLKQAFLPEFLGRLSGLVEFNPLTKDHCRLILNKIVQEFNESKLSKKPFKVTLSSTMEEHLLENGFNPTYGARPLKNFFNEEVLAKLADLLLSGESFTGDVTIHRVNGEISFIKSTLAPLMPTVPSDTEPVVSITALEKYNK